MSLSDELISQFAKITNDKKTSRIDEVTLYGEVVKCDDSICVRFDGSEELTPVTTIAEKDDKGNITNFKYGAASVKTGDRVSVALKNHSATITGNLTDPPMGRAEVKVNDDSIVATVGDKVKVQIDAMGVRMDNFESGVNLSLNNMGVQINGLTTITNGLSNGTTTIDGACIKTGTIDANRLNLTGAIAFGDLSSDVQNGINSAQTAADNAQSTANSAQTAASNAQSTADSAESTANSAWTKAKNAADSLDNLVSDWGYTYDGTTYIDGTRIMTGTVTASSIQGGEVILLDDDEIKAAAFTLTGAKSYDGAKLLITTGAFEVDARYGDIYLESGANCSIQISDDVACSGDFRPRDVSSNSLGTDYYMWRDVYTHNDPIVTSDANVKKDVVHDLTGYESFFNALSPCTYKFIDGESGRTHLGMISQDVEKALVDCNISDMDFAGFIKSPKKDEKGNVVDGEYAYALRYGEFIPLLIWQVQKLKARVAELEETHG